MDDEASQGPGCSRRTSLVRRSVTGQTVRSCGVPGAKEVPRFPPMPARSVQQYRGLRLAERHVLLLDQQYRARHLPYEFVHEPPGEIVLQPVLFMGR